MSERSFFSRIFGGETDEDATRTYSAEEIEMRKFMRREPEEDPQPQGFTAERAAQIIDDLPPDVPRESAVRIVRGTLEAAGIQFEDMERSTRMREAKLNSEIELARGRQEDLRARTEAAVLSLEEEIRKAEEARDTGLAREDENVSTISKHLREVRRMRSFFGFPDLEGEVGDETQTLDPPDVDQTEVIRRPGPFPDPGER